MQRAFTHEKTPRQRLWQLGYMCVFESVVHVRSFIIQWSSCRKTYVLQQRALQQGKMFVGLSWLAVILMKDGLVPDR